MSTKDDKRRGPGRPASKTEPAASYSVRVPPELDDALTAYLKTLRPMPSASETFRVALEDFLQARGFWTPKN